MQKFLVTVRDKEGTVHNIICDDRDTLGNLMFHIDEGEYKIESVHVLDNVLAEIKDLCKKNNIEHGGHT